MGRNAKEQENPMVDRAAHQDGMRPASRRFKQVAPLAQAGDFCEAEARVQVKMDSMGERTSHAPMKEVNAEL
jgi:hypothetical protein